MMDLISSHISNFIDDFTKSPPDGYLDAYELIPNENVGAYNRFLIYLDKVLDFKLAQENNEVKFIHIHVLGADSDLINVVSNYLMSKFFMLGIKGDEMGSDFLRRRIETLNLIIKNRPWPQDAKRNNRASQNESEFRDRFKSNIDFLRDIQLRFGSCSFRPETVYNLTQHQAQYADLSFYSKEVFVPIESFPKSKSYVVVNTGFSRDKIDSLYGVENGQLFSFTKNVVIFDCEQRRLHRMFNTRDLIEWNSNGCTFKNLIVFTFSKERFLYSKVRREIDRIHSRFNTKSTNGERDSIVITDFETSRLLNRTAHGLISPTPIFYGDDICSFWQAFLFILDTHENLYELRSLKLMTIYCLVTTVETKDILIEDLFNKSESEVLSTETKEILRELPSESLLLIKSNLSYTLDWIIGSKWREEIMSHVDPSIKIVIPEIVTRFRLFAESFTKSIGLSGTSNLIAWNKIPFESNVLVLNYKDIGAFPFEFEGNYEGFQIDDNHRISQLLLSIFFKGRFQWSFFNLNRERIKMLKQGYRDHAFEWSKLTSRQFLDRPAKNEVIRWDFERALQEGYQSQILKVIFKGQRKSKSFFASDLFVVAQENELALEVMTLAEISEEDPTETSLKIQHLESLYADANFFERSAKLDYEKVAIDTTKVRSEHGIDDSVNFEVLWKLLLKKKGNPTFIHTELTNIFEKQRLTMVSKYTLSEYWMNPKSSTLIPRENKAFWSVCGYLNLPPSYYLWMLKLKNAEKLEARNSSRHMNGLLTDLINDGCFNEASNSKEILSSKKTTYLTNHGQEFEQFGFVHEKIVDDLCTLVDLIKPYLKLMALEKVITNES